MWYKVSSVPTASNLGTRPEKPTSTDTQKYRSRHSVSMAPGAIKIHYSFGFNKMHYYIYWTGGLHHNKLTLWISGNITSMHLAQLKAKQEKPVDVLHVSFVIRYVFIFVYSHSNLPKEEANIQCHDLTKALAREIYNCAIFYLEVKPNTVVVHLYLLWVCYQSQVCQSDFGC